MKIFRIVPFCALALCASAGSLESFIAPAQALTGEFSSEALIRIAASPDLQPARRMELLDLAFDRAAGAREPYKRRPIGLRVQAASGYAGKVYLQDMDALSLRLRAVEAMLPLDAARARALFGRIPAIALPRLKCQDAYVYDVSRFYDVLAMLLKTAPEPAKLLERYAAITAPEQAGPMARLIPPPACPTRSFLLSSPSTRNRSAASKPATAPSARSGCSAGISRTSPPSAPGARLRLFRCLKITASTWSSTSPRSGARTTKPWAGWPFSSAIRTAADMEAVDMASFFNKNLRQDPLKPIEESDSTPTRLEGTAAMPRICAERRMPRLRR